MIYLSNQINLFLKLFIVILEKGVSKMEVTITLPNNFKNLTESERLTIISKEIESLQKQHSDIQSKWSKIAQRMRKKIY